MKIEHKSWKRVGGILAALALCGTASAQYAGNRQRSNNLGNDIRDSSHAGRGPLSGYGTVQDAGSMEVPQDQKGLDFELTLSVEPYDASSLRALIPAKQEMKKTLRLNGRPFDPVELVIMPRVRHNPVEPTMGSGHAARGFTIRGEIGANGSMVIELPPAVESAGVFVQGYSPIRDEFTAVMDLDQAIAEAYLSWSVEAAAEPSHGRPLPQIIVCPGEPALTWETNAARVDHPSRGAAKPAEQELVSRDAQRTDRPAHFAKPGGRRPIGPGHVMTRR